MILAPPLPVIKIVKYCGVRGGGGGGGAKILKKIIASLISVIKIVQDFGIVGGGGGGAKILQTDNGAPSLCH